LLVKALQFDEVKLITGSMDCTLKVWDWRKGKCIRTLTGHTEGVVCLNYDSNVLASGSVDSTVRVWNLRTGGSFVLRGHSDWVNSVQLWDSNTNSSRGLEDTSVFGMSGPNLPPSAIKCSYRIDPGKMLFSGSDDGTIKLWDLNNRTCVRQFVGHMGHVQSIKLLYSEELETEDSDGPPASLTSSSSMPGENESVIVPKYKKPVLVSGSLDNTVKLWDIDTGKATRTYFGHLEGVWAVAADQMRLVSGSHDRTIKACIRSFSYLFYH
jgi:F-box/WD-40 domain protein MET30